MTGSSAAGVHPSQIGEAGEVGVGSVKDVAALHCEDGEVRVRREIRCRSEPFEFAAKPREMRVRRLWDMNVRQVEPTLYSPHNVGHRKGPAHDPAVGGDPDEAEKRGPSEPDALGARQTVIPPASRPVVKKRVGVVRVDEQIDIRQDHEVRE